MRALEAHFERMLAGWTTDEALRAKWREFLHGREPAADEPRVAPPPLFRGRADAGALVDHTKLSAPMLHDLLAESDLLPERGRRAPILPTPGLPT